MSVIEIPGGTAQFRDTVETERQRRLLQGAAVKASKALGKFGELATEVDTEDEAEIIGALSQIDIDPADLDVFNEIQDVAIMAFLKSWNIGRPLPSKNDLLDLPLEIYTPIAQEASRLYTEWMQSASGKAEEQDFSPNPQEFTSTGERRPTGSSTSLETPFEAEAELSQIQTQLTGGTSTSSASSSM